MATETEVPGKLRVVKLPHQTSYWEDVSKILTEIKGCNTIPVAEFSKLYRTMYSKIEPVASAPTLKNLQKVSTLEAEPGCLTAQLLPYIADLALRVTVLFPEPIPLLVHGLNQTVCATRLQVACILANAIFDLIPVQTMNMQVLTLIDLLNIALFDSQLAKLTCILEYFRRIWEHEKKGDMVYLNRIISVERRFLLATDTPSFGETTSPLSSFTSFPTGLIEEAHGCLQADFANQYIGGGVLSTGNVQEEIRFVVSPECLFSLLICEVMLPNETIIISGAERFSKYSGYGGGFKFIEPHFDENAIDQRNRSLTSIVCMDALEGCGGIKDQCKVIPFKRELIKSCCGFSCDESLLREGDSIRKLPIASGNWGCGMFGGNKEVKTIIQWISASLSGRELRYYTFNDKNLTERQEAFVKVCVENNLTTGDLYNLCMEFGARDTEEVGVFEYIYNILNKKAEPSSV